MSPTEIILLLALTGYAIYRQTQRHEVVGSGRFTMAIIYGIVGLAVGRLAPARGRRARPRPLHA